MESILFRAGKPKMDSSIDIEMAEENKDKGESTRKRKGSKESVPAKEASAKAAKKAAPKKETKPWAPSDEVLRYLKSVERYMPRTYKDPNGVETVGYGFTQKEVVDKYRDKDMSREEADKYFDGLVKDYTKEIQRGTPHWDELTNHQKDALFSYFYNLGYGHYTKGSDKMQEAMRNRDWDEVARQMDYDYNNPTVPGARVRRDLERRLFHTPDSVSVDFLFEPETPVKQVELSDFGKAFDEAKRRGDKVFEWNGKKYAVDVKADGGDTDDVEASFMLPEVDIYPQNRWGDIARAQGLQTARNWRDVRNAVTEGRNEFVNDPRTQAAMALLPIPSGIEGAEVLSGALRNAGNRFRTFVASKMLDRSDIKWRNHPIWGNTYNIISGPSTTKDYLYHNVTRDRLVVDKDGSLALEPAPSDIPGEEGRIWWSRGRPFGGGARGTFRIEEDKIKDAIVGSGDIDGIVSDVNAKPYPVTGAVKLDGAQKFGYIPVVSRGNVYFENIINPRGTAFGPNLKASYPVIKGHEADVPIFAYEDGGDVRNTYPQDAPMSYEEALSLILNSDANFVRRLKAEGRATIPDWERPDKVATHKMAAEIGEDGRAYMFPEVQEIDGKLYDFTDPKSGHGNRHVWDALDSAVEHGDYVVFPNIGLADWFARNYKDLGVFPKFEEGGGVEDLSVLASRDNTSVGKPGISASIPSGGVSDAARENPVIPFVASLLPGIGDAIDAHEFIQAAKDKDAVGMALAAAGFVPLVGDAVQEALRSGRLFRNLAARFRGVKSTVDIPETDEELLRAMPDYVRVDFSTADAPAYHRRRLDDGEYEMLTGQPVNEAISELEEYESRYPGILNKVFYLDDLDAENNLEAARRALEIFKKVPPGQYKGMPKEQVSKALRPYRLSLAENPAFAEGKAGNMGIFANWEKAEQQLGDFALQPAISHELSHGVFYNMPHSKQMEMGRGVKKWFDSAKVGNPDMEEYISRTRELAARGTQIKDFYGLTKADQAVTPEMLKFAARHYANSVMDNQMTEFFNGITDWDAAARWITKYSPATAAGIVMGDWIKNGEEVDDTYNKMFKGGHYPVVPLSEDGTMVGIGYRVDGGHILARRRRYIAKKLKKDYGIADKDIAGILNDLTARSWLNDKYYDIKHKSYGIGQWSGNELKDFVATYRDGGLDDQIDFLAKRYKMMAGGDSIGDKVLDEGGETGGSKAKNLYGALSNPKDAAYKIMQRSAGEATLGINDVLDIILDDDPGYGHYAGGTEGVEGSFDFPRMYIYGEAEGAEELSDEDKSHGVDYTPYLEKIGRDPSKVKQYAGDFGSEIVLPESYREVIDHVLENGKDKTIGFNSSYFGGGGDDVGGYLGKIRKDGDGNYVMDYSDLWDFHPGDYARDWGDNGRKFLAYVESWLLDKVGTPFIVRSKKGVRFVPDDEYNAEVSRLRQGPDEWDPGKESVENSREVMMALDGMSSYGIYGRDLYPEGAARMMMYTPMRDYHARREGGPITDILDAYRKSRQERKALREGGSSAGLSGASIIPYLPKGLLWRMAYGEGGNGIYGNQALLEMESGGGISRIEDYVFDSLVNDYDIPEVQAVGIMANLKMESNFNPKALGDNGRSYGLNQWQGERRKALFDWAKGRGNDTPDLDDQISFLVHEYKGGRGFLDNAGAGRNLYRSGRVNRPTFDYWQYSRDDFDGAGNYLDATRAWAQGFGRGNKEFFNMDKRFNAAKSYADRYGVKLSGDPVYGEMGKGDVPDGTMPEDTGQYAAAQQEPYNITVQQGMTPEMLDYMERYGKSLVEAALKGAKGLSSSAGEDDGDDDESRKMDEQMAQSAAYVSALQEKQARARFAMEMADAIKLDIKGNPTVRDR